MLFFWITVGALLFSICWGMLGTMSLYDRVGHGGLSLDVTADDDLDRIAREGR